MKTFKALIGITALVAATASNAAVLHFDYSFNGTSLTPSAGYSEMFGTNVAVGDTVSLTYRAVGAKSYWDLGAVGNASNVNLGFDVSTSCGTRSASGAYSASLDGSVILSRSYSVSGQSCVHLGPEYIDFGAAGHVDVFSISYTLDSSTAGANVIGSYSSDTWWQVWELFNGTKANFVYVADAPAPNDVPEPAIPALLLAGVAGMAIVKRRRS